MDNRLKEIREKKGLTQLELAQQSSVSRTVICQLENGVRTVVTSDTMLKLAKALGTSVNDIFLFN